MKHIKTIEEMLLIEVINKQDKELNKHLHPEIYTDKDSFLKYARKRKKELGKIDPSTEFQFIRYVDEEWCVHFLHIIKCFSINLLNNYTNFLLYLI